MAKAVYKNMTSDYKNMTLMSAVGVALSSWRESYGANQYGEFEDGTKYEGVYRVEHGGGTTAVLVKYLMFIKQHDPKFDLDKRIKEIMGEKYPKF